MNQQRKRTNLTVFLPTGDRSLAVPLPIPLSAASSSSSSINPSDLVRIRILGRGNSGPVHLVCDRFTGQQYALKIVQGLHEDSISGHNSREIEILRTTDSPFIVGCHGLFHQGGEIQILLEYMDRGTMGSLSRPIPEQKLAKMASQILQGLAYLHQQKIVHRDIKPTNILMNGQGQVKISDFGVSRFLTGTGACNSLVGTIVYMSPEQISNQGSDYDGYASDIWSFGMSILECSLESFPIVLATDDEVDWACMRNEISFKMPPEAPAKSEDFQSFIKCCLQNQPSDRWTAEQLLEHPFIKQARRNTPAPIDQHSSASSSSSNSPICPSSSLQQQQQQRMKEPMAASAMVLDPPPPPPSPPPPLPPPSIPAVRSDPRQPNSSPCSDDDDDLYSCLKSLQRQNEFINIRQENIKDEHKYLKRELLRAHEELKQIQSVPQVVGQFMEMVDQINGIVESPTGSNYYVPILSTINPELLKPSASVALHRLSNSIVDVLPPEADSSISLLSQSEKPNITYDDIGGCEIQKQEIREAIELPLTHPELYKQIGIDPPRGVLLYGPPGTGKTMLAKAVANHTTAAFIPMVGSEFLQKYMGEGARMVRDVFRLAKENAPAIIFIDEVDAIATARLDAESGSEREVHRILIELLNQMDGFEQTVNVKVIMATNRADTLDPALLRPGRIDRIIEFPLPDRREKKLVFQVCTAKMNLSDEVDLEDYVSLTDRVSPAEIAAICQEAGMHAIRKNRYVILQKDVERGYRRIVKKPDTDFDFYN